MADDARQLLLNLTADIVTAHVSNNHVSVVDLHGLIAQVHASLAGLGKPVAREEEQKPAVSARASVKRDHLVCLEEGKEVKLLKRHLAIEHGVTPAAYRAKWNLPPDYPMVPPGYSKVRRELALRFGLGGKERRRKEGRGD